MSKKIIGIAIAVFVGVCAAESLLALRKALQEKAAAEAAAAEAAEAEAGEAQEGEPVEG